MNIMSSNDNKRKRVMDSGVRRQFGTEANRRYLRDLPIFRVDSKLPPTFNDLLEEIDRAKQKRSGQQG